MAKGNPLQGCVGEAFHILGGDGLDFVAVRREVFGDERSQRGHSRAAENRAAGDGGA